MKILKSDVIVLASLDDTYLFSWAQVQNFHTVDLLCNEALERAALHAMKCGCWRELNGKPCLWSLQASICEAQYDVELLNSVGTTVPYPRQDRSANCRDVPIADLHGSISGPSIS